MHINKNLAFLLYEHRALFSFKMHYLWSFQMNFALLILHSFYCARKSIFGMENYGEGRYW